jgi:hypothetical protein
MSFPPRNELAKVAPEGLSRPHRCSVQNELVPNPQEVRLIQLHPLSFAAHGQTHDLVFTVKYTANSFRLQIALVMGWLLVYTTSFQKYR